MPRDQCSGTEPSKFDSSGSYELLWGPMLTERRAIEFAREGHWNFANNICIIIMTDQRG